MIDRIYSYISKKGYTFDKKTIINFYVSLKTKPFVILTGISGTGKTKLAQLFTEAIYKSEKEKYFKMVPIQPDWNAPRFLLGFYNPLTEKYETKPFLEILISAVTDEKHAYFVCLDEMNLARVEYYFSTFLSALESGVKIDLHSEKDKKGNDIEKDGVPAKIKVPKNLYFIGTVNIDETTHQFSPKVLDRANVIEFNEVKLMDVFDTKKTEPSENENEKNKDANSNGIDLDDFSTEFMADKKGKKWDEWFVTTGKMLTEKYLTEINNILEASQLHFGYRVRNEILEYMFWAKEFFEPDNKKDGFTQNYALDLQVMQKILPKIKGGRRIKETLVKLKEFLERKDIELDKSAKRVSDMLKALDEGYTSFWG